MTRVAHHHFDYRKDGHTRVYDMSFRAPRHVIAKSDGSKNPSGGGPVAEDASGGGPNPEPGVGAISPARRRYVPGQLSLTRREDGHSIPFKELRAVSLIALLRMGLSKRHRRVMYRQFVKMPLFEDMAPWNIVLVGHDLAYIDQDTQDKTFTASVALAYQTMSALMNYIRTVKDFKHCRGKAKGGNLYGIPFISDCVGSPFHGPCTSPSKPVPCGDRTCRSTFVECLQELLHQDSRHHVEGAGDGLPEPGMPARQEGPASGLKVMTLASENAGEERW
mmetsp:Transcript_882/g.2162  ORF Transcript_882/g.2162 Transcript_882/m.2162 type:complete len:277 (+) Transcript_882:204-1034(+)